jgi:hypothetical protein
MNNLRNSMQYIYQKRIIRLTVFVVSLVACNQQTHVAVVLI